MAYNGIDIDMLYLGKADSILVSRWYGTSATTVLIDGGNKDSFETVRSHLSRLKITWIDHVVCTHLHDDHARGLVELLRDQTVGIGRLWVHIPEFHIEMATMERALRAKSGLWLADTIRRSLETVGELVSAAQRRNLSISEPFAGDQIGFLTVVGPSSTYYETLINEMADPDRLQEHARRGSIERLIDAFPEVREEPEHGLIDEPTTTPENNSSTILRTIVDGCKYVFTADAGVEALRRAALSWNLERCSWFQIPHHGSRRNINQGLIEYFRPAVAYVSAPGSPKHPRRAVVNAFNRVGSSVYSTHYPSEKSLWHHRGTTPERGGYGSATSLYNA